MGSLTITKERVEEMKFAYTQQLHSLRQFVLAAELTKYTANKGIIAMHPPLIVTCSNNLVMRCGVCRLPCSKGLYVWYQKCGHGGHIHHIRNWSMKHRGCPVCSSGQ